MSSEQTPANIVPVQTNTALQTSSSLLSRGLDDLDNKVYTMEDIRKAYSDHEELSGLTAEAVLLVLEQPTLWKGRLFFQVLGDEVKKYQTMHRSRARLSSFSKDTEIDGTNFGDWIIAQLNYFMALSDDASVLLKGLSSIADDSEQHTLLSITNSAVQLGLIYHSFCEWGHNIVSASSEKKFSHLLQTLSHVLDPIIEEFEAYAPRSLAIIKEGMSQINTGQTIHLNLKLKFDMNKIALDEVSREISRLNA